MDAFAPINRVSLEQYAELAALMAETGSDKGKCAEIAEANGISRTDWEAAQIGWTARMSDATLMGKVALAFMPLYQAAMDRKRNGQVPMSLEDFARISADAAFRKDPVDLSKQINLEIILVENDITRAQWLECNTYWSPRVNDPNDPASSKFRELMQQNSDRIFGIQR